MKKSILLTLVCLILLLGGCFETVPLATQNAEKDRLEAKIAANEKEYKENMAKKEREIEGLRKEFQSTIVDKMQFCSDRLYGADLAFQFDKERDRTDMIIHNRVNEARTVLPPVSAAGIAQDNERLTKELDETKTSLAELQKSHQKVVDEAKDIVKKSDKIQKELNDALSDKKKIEDDFRAKVETLQDKLNKLNDEIIARNGNEKVRLELESKERLYIIGVLTSAALLSGLGAIFIPIPQVKKGLAIFGAICLAAAIAIPFVKAWMVAVGILGLCLPLGGYLLYGYMKEYKSATSTYKGLENLKVNQPEVWEKTVLPELTSEQSKYVKKDGKIETVPDKSISDHIDARLVETDSK
jgi:Skp family chaperone for outer membrane proteins